MKKTSFYTMINHREHGPMAKLVDGYSDGTKIYYYRTGGCAQYTWAAVHDETGLAICYGYTRAEAMRNARNPELLARVCSVLDSEEGARMRERFTNAVCKAKTA